MNILKEEIQKDFPNRRVVSIEILFGYISTLVEMSTRYYRASAISIQKAMINKERCIDIIGHSLGGFVGRAYIQLFSGRADSPSVRRLYTLAGVMGGFYCFESCGKHRGGVRLRIA